MKSNLFMLVIIQVFFIVSCKKQEDAVAPDRLFLKEITYVNGNTKTEQFDYSSDGLLTKHEIIFNGVVEQYENYYYSGKKPDHSEYYVYDYSGDKYLLQFKRNYDYDDHGRLTVYIEEDVPSGRFNYAEFYYAGDKIDSIAFQVIDEAYNTTLDGYYILTTDVEGNILTSKKRLIDQPDIYNLIGYVYDSKVNPLQGLVNPMDFITYFSSANLIKDQSSTYIYKYNEKDLPVSRNQRYGQAPLDTVSMMLNFVYEGL